MKIKLIILDNDLNYLRRVVSAFETKYADKVEVYSFSDKEKAVNCLSREKIDIILMSDSAELEKERIPKRTCPIYLVESNGVDIKNDCKAIGKYQKADLIYKQILSSYAEQSESVLGGIGMGMGDSSTRMVAFSSPCGGTGTSSMAAAYALRLARAGKRVLYLNLEKLGSADVFFSAEGSGTFGEIIYSLKRRTNLSIKLESCVKNDVRGVSFFSQPKEALHMMELTEEETERLLRELEIAGTYDCVVADLDFRLDVKFVSLLKKMNRIIMVTDGSLTANVKIIRAISSLDLMGKSDDIAMTKKVALIYNKYSNKTGRAVEGINVAQIGGSPRFEHASCDQVIEELSKHSMLDQI